MRAFWFYLYGACLMGLGAVCLATSAHAATCEPPNVARAVVAPAYGTPSQLGCPSEGLCWQTSTWVERAVVIHMICLTPSDHAAALERGKR